MRVSTIRAVPVLLALATGLTACGSAHTTQTVPTVASAVTPTTTAVTPAPAQTDTNTTPTATTTTATAMAPTPADGVTTATITAPDSGGAPLSGTASTATTTQTAVECTAADLRVDAVPPNSGPGTTVLGFELTNASAHPCVSEGWPGIALIGASDAVTDVSTTRTTSDDLGSTPETKVTLGPGQVMSFRITLHDDGSGCHSYGGVQIIAPNDTATLDAQISDGPVQSCGTVAVSPVEPGATATGQ
jgi:hypothetical protein